MVKCLTQNWRQVIVQWCNALRQVGIRYWSPQRVTLAGEQGWLSPRCISGGPVHAVEESEAEVMIMTTFPKLASTEVTIELAGDRLLIQGKSPWALPETDTGAFCKEGNYDVLIRSAVLPCAVDLAQASVTRKNNILQITLPKKTRVHPRRVHEKRQE